jgi:putative hydrolase of the HAD superfamily
MPAFFYFDLGKVLIDFELHLMFRQMAEVAGVDSPAVMAALMENGLQRQYEMGGISTAAYFEAFCQRTGTRADRKALAKANREIFRLNEPMERLIRGLHRAGLRLGVLSNTHANHWDYCRRHFPVLQECFAVHVLSYRVGACKPDAAIFHAAAEMAGLAPEDIFFTDDMAEHVAAARAVGFDALQFTSLPQLIAELRQRGVEVAAASPGR